MEAPFYVLGHSPSNPTLRLRMKDRSVPLTRSFGSITALSYSSQDRLALAFNTGRIAVFHWKKVLPT